MTDETPPQPHRVVYLEIWRPLRYIGTSGPRVFWREHLLVGFTEPFDGWEMNDKGVRVPVYRPPQPKWGPPSPWRVMDKRVAQYGLTNTYFTLDEHPGVTFCCRKARDLTEKDWREVRALRMVPQ